MASHYTIPSFAARNQNKADTYTLKYNPDKQNYSLTLTDTNNTLANLSLSASGIKVSRSGNQYTFTSDNLEKLLITMTIVVSLTMIFVGCYLMKAHLALGIALLAFGAAVVFATCFVGVRIEHDTGYYECPVCKKRYVPTMKAVVMALHSGTSRKMKCPYCGNKSYHKKVLTK